MITIQEDNRLSIGRMNPWPNNKTADGLPPDGRVWRGNSTQKMTILRHYKVSFGKRKICFPFLVILFK